LKAIPPRVSALGRALLFCRGIVRQPYFYEVLVVSIIRIGLAETKHFSEGYEAIFGGKKKKDDQEKPVKGEADAKKEAKKAVKKKGKK
jgi:hypothetical protein